MKKIYLLLMMTATFIAMGCGGSGSNDEDDDTGGGSGSSSSGATIKEGWYIPEDFISDRVEGLKKEVNYWVQKGYTEGSQYFDDEGGLCYPNKQIVEWGVYDASMTALHILDKKTLQTFGNAFFYRPGSTPQYLKLKQLLFTVDLGPIVGKVGCYATGGSYYNYIQTENGFCFSDYEYLYEEFIYRNGQLFRNGGGRWVEFDPNEQFKVETQAKKHYIYGDVENHPEQTPFQPEPLDGLVMRFSDTKGTHFPTIPDEVYFGQKTLIFDISDARDCDIRVTNGWWSNIYYDHVKFVSGLNEIKITQTMAKECAMGNDGAGKDLNIILLSGTCTINAVYYEE